MPEELFYHAFPRRPDADANSKGLAILSSIADSGLLLVPENVSWPGELRDDGSISEPLTSSCQRVCFTCLTPGAVARHATKFGPFALELDDLNLRTLGAAPVFYVPVSENTDGLAPLPMHFLHRIAQVTELLERLSMFFAVFKSAPPDTPVFASPSPCGGLKFGTPNGDHFVTLPKLLVDQVRHLVAIPDQPVPLNATSTAVMSIISVMTWGSNSLQTQLGGLRALGGMFYPCERSNKDELLSYYRQREWRVLADSVRFGEAVTREPTPAEVDRLLALDPAFFGKEVDFRTGRKRIVDRCSYFSRLAGKHVLQYVKRLICPSATVADARRILDSAGFSAMPIISIEELA